MRPVRHISMALDLPTKRVRRWLPPMPGITPSLISGWPNFAVSAARIKSHIMASSQPPPNAKPATAGVVWVPPRSKAFPLAEPIGPVHLAIGLVLHFLDVGASCERFGRSGYDDAADFW